MGILWGIVGILWTITFVGIPVVKQFKITKVYLFPSEKAVVFRGGVTSFI